MSTSSHSLWRHRDFVLLWGGQAVSSFGTLLDALLFTALLYLDGSPAQLGVLAMAQGLPVLLFAIYAGVWIDRLPRRPVMIVADLGRAVLLLSVPAAAVFGVLSMAQLYVVAFVFGSLSLAFELAYRSYLPRLVAPEQIVEGNSKLAGSDAVAEVAAPAIGGAIVQAVGGPVAALIDSLTFVWSAGCVALIRHREPVQERVEGRSMLAEAREGIGAVWRDPVLRALALDAGTMRFFGGFLQALYWVFLIRTLGFSPLVVGLTIGAGGVGSIAGSVLAGPMTRRLGFGGTLILCRVLPFSALIALAGGPSWLAFAMIVVAQAAGDPFWAAYEIASLSLRQAITPERLLGRVSSCMHLMQAGLLPLGALTAGLLAEALGVRETVAVGVVGGTLGSLWLVFSPVRGLRAGVVVGEAGG